MNKKLLILIMFFSFGCMNEKQQSEIILRHFINKKVDLLRNYTIESAIAIWNANVSGCENDYQKIIDVELDFNKANHRSSEQFEPDRITEIARKNFTSEEDFQLIRKLKNSGVITDTLLARQLTVLYHAYMGPQVEAERYKKILDAEVKLWQVFSKPQFEVDGKKYNFNQIDSLRKSTSDNEMLKKVYDTLRRQGKQISADIVAMVKLRNEFAESFGYKDFYQLTLEIIDQTPEKIKMLGDEIELKTRKQFFEAKTVIDKLLSKKFRVPVSELGPWNYNDERTSYLPQKFSEKLDTLFKNTDPIRIASEFFAGIGLPVQDVIDISDLKYRPGKSASTFMLNVDFKNDLRMFSSIQNNVDGMKKMMHICGHTAHYKSISETVPYLIKAPNSIVAEGVSVFFENLVTSYSWLKNEFNLDTIESRRYMLICQHLFQVDRLFRCRKYLAMAEFEREIYRDPDQNLGKLWSQINRKYLGINLNEENNSSDWAVSKYATSFSCTVQNYLLADLFAAQLQHAVEKEVFQDKQFVYQNNKSVGNFLVSHLFKYGDVLPWSQLIEKSTGEPLNPSYFIDVLIDE